MLALFGSRDDIPQRDAEQRALLVTTPGEKHVFGMDMVAEFMRAAGWDVMAAHHVSPRQAAALVKRERFGILGVALSSHAGLETAAQLIKSARQAPAVADLRVIVGGPLFLHEPELVAQVGADASAQDAPTAVMLARKLLITGAAPK